MISVATAAGFNVDIDIFYNELGLMFMERIAGSVDVFKDVKP